MSLFPCGEGCGACLYSVGLSVSATCVVDFCYYLCYIEIAIIFMFIEQVSCSVFPCLSECPSCLCMGLARFKVHCWHHPIRYILEVPNVSGRLVP